MKRIIPSFFLVMLLIACSGCTSTPPPTEVPVNETPTLPVLHHNDVAVDLSGIEVRDPELFTANLTSTITTVLPDSRAGLLLDHGWNITSVRQEFDEEVLDRPYVRVEFMKNNLSFYFLVDEEKDQIIRGYCGAKVWVAGPISGPLPKDYSQSFDKHTRRLYVYDYRNGTWSDNDEVTVYTKNGISVFVEDKEVMIYDKNDIYYLDHDF